MHNLSENESTKMVTQLSARGISAFRDKQTDGRWTVSVDSADTKLALKLIDSRRLLRDDRRQPEETGSLLSSREEQRFRFERSLSREVEGTIGALDGVLDARVHLNLPPIDPLLGQPLIPGKGTASVLVIAGDEFKALPSEIGAIVSGASGVPLDYVSVLVSKAVEDEPAAIEKPISEPQGSGDQRGGVAPLDFAWDDRLIEGILSALILVIGLYAMRRAFRGRRKISVRLGESESATPLEAAL